MSDRRRDAATAAVGAGGVAGGAVLRESGLQRAHQLAGKDKRVLVPSRALLMAPKSKARGRARAMWAGGSALALAGTPATAVGAYRLARPDRAAKRAPREEERSFLGEGVRGAAEALRERGESAVATPRQARAVPLAAGLAGGAVGAQAGHKVADLVARRTPVNPKVRAAATSLTAVGGGLASMPAANAVMRRRAPGYEVTPTGVRRVKTAPVRPSRLSTTARGRREIVPSDRRFAKYYGENMSRGQKRARVLAAGTVPIPIVNDIAAASQAARMAPPSQRRQAFANTAGGIAAGTVAGAGLGAAAGRALERRNPRLAQRAVATDEAVRERVRTSRPARAAASSAPGQAAARARARLPKGSGRLKGKLTPAVLLGAGLGQMPGGQAGGWMGYSRTLNAEARYKQERRAKLAKAEGLNQREREKLARTKRHSAALSVIGGTAGIGALGALGGSKLKLLKPATRARLSAAQTPLLTTSAGTGGINAFLGAKVQNREAKQVEAAKRFPGYDKNRLHWMGAGGSRARVRRRAPLRPEAREVVGRSSQGRYALSQYEDPLSDRARPGALARSAAEARAMPWTLRARTPGAEGGSMVAPMTSRGRPRRVRGEWDEAAKALVPLGARRPAYVDSHLRRRRHASGLVSTSRVRAGVR